MNIKTVSFILFWVVLASCSSQKNIPPTLTVDTKGLFRYDTLLNYDTTVNKNITVESYFKDEKLVNLIHKALSGNVNIKLALERINQAQAQFNIARASQVPSLSVVAQNQYTTFSTGNLGTKVFGYNTNQLNLGFCASWELDVWGKLSQTKKARLAGLLNTYEVTKLTRTEIISQIASGYYNLLALDDQLNSVYETISLLEKELETMQALWKAGNQNGAAVEQSKALLYSTQLSVYEIQNRISQQENALSVLIGEKLGIINRNKLGDVTIPSELKTGISAQQLANRPDIKSAQLTFQEAFSMTQVAKSNFYPNIRFSNIMGGLTSSGFARLFNPESIAADIIGSLTMPLFSQGQLKGNLKIAQSQQQEAALNFSQKILIAGQEISDIMFGFYSAEHKKSIREQQIQSLLLSVKYTTDLLKAGEANYMEVLNAQQNLLSAKLAKSNDKLEQLNYIVNLYKAMGGSNESL